MPVRACRFCLLAATVLTACTPALMRIDEPLKAEGVFNPLSQKAGLFDAKPYVIGDFRTTKLDLSWAKGRGGSLAAAGMGQLDTQMHQSVTFTLLDTKLKKSLDASCKWTRHREAVKIDKLTTSSETQAVSCTLQPQGGGEPWSLTLQTSAMEAMSGSLKRGSDEYVVASEQETESGYKVMDPLGYSFRHKDQAAAQVVISTEPGIWLHKALLEEQRLVLASASTALLIKAYRDSTKSELSH